MRRASDGAVALQPGKEVCKVVGPRERDRLEVPGFDAHVPTAVCCAQLIFGGSRGFAHHDHLVRGHRLRHRNHPRSGQKARPEALPFRVWEMRGLRELNLRRRWPAQATRVAQLLWQVSARCVCLLKRERPGLPSRNAAIERYEAKNELRESERRLPRFGWRSRSPIASVSKRGSPAMLPRDAAPCSRSLQATRKLGLDVHPLVLISHPPPPRVTSSPVSASGAGPGGGGGRQPKPLLATRKLGVVAHPRGSSATVSPPHSCSLSQACIARVLPPSCQHHRHPWKTGKSIDGLSAHELGPWNFSDLLNSGHTRGCSAAGRRTLCPERRGKFWRRALRHICQDSWRTTDVPHPRTRNLRQSWRQTKRRTRQPLAAMLNRRKDALLPSGGAK